MPARRTTLTDVAAFLPSRRVPVEELGPELGLTPIQVRVLRRFNGLGEVRRQQPGESLVDLLEGAARALPTLGGRKHLVRYVLTRGACRSWRPTRSTPCTT